MKLVEKNVLSGYKIISGAFVHFYKCRFEIHFSGQKIIYYKYFSVKWFLDVYIVTWGIMIFLMRDMSWSKRISIPTSIPIHFHFSPFDFLPFLFGSAERERETSSPPPPFLLVACPPACFSSLLRQLLLPTTFSSLLRQLLLRPTLASTRSEPGSEPDPFPTLWALLSLINIYGLINY